MARTMKQISMCGLIYKKAFVKYINVCVCHCGFVLPGIPHNMAVPVIPEAVKREKKIEKR